MKRLLVPGAGSRHALAVIAAALLAATGAPALADPQRAELDELKNVYLVCDHAATRTSLDRAAAAFCSRYSEELLRRGFAGDFGMLLAWWREARAQAIAAQDRGADPSSGQAN